VELNEYLLNVRVLPGARFIVGSGFVVPRRNIVVQERLLHSTLFLRHSFDLRHWEFVIALASPRSQTQFGNALALETQFPHTGFVRSRYRINNPDSSHFITSTIVKWLPVFTTPARCDIIVRSLTFCHEHKSLKIYAWVILDNHFHAIVSGPELSRTIGDLKKFTARQILAQLEHERCEWLLNQFQYFRAAHKTASTHQVWQEGVHPQSISSDEMMLQKLEYLHNNRGAPRAGKFAGALALFFRTSVARGGDPAVALRSMALTNNGNRVSRASAFPNGVWERDPSRSFEA
jgi:putative transposase